MLSYALLASDKCRPSQGQDGPTLEGMERTVLDPRMTLFAPPGVPWIAGSRSLLIGRLFDRETSRPIADGAALDQALAGGFSSLIETHWGQYVLIAILGGVMTALRDPSGAVSCYCGGEQRDFLVSDAGTAMALGLINDPAVDPAFLAHWLRFPFLRSARTGLMDVEELLPGSACTLGARAPPARQYWRARSFARPAAGSFEKAAADLCRTALATIAVAAGEGPLLVQLSGGLDSSILAACLAAGGRKVEAVTFATSSPDGDEQRYAKAVADHLGIGLKVLQEDDPAEEAEDRLMFRPGPNILLERIDQLVERYRREIGAVRVADGGGGDSLFGFSRTAAAVIDAIGSGEAWATLQSIGERSSASLWQVAWTALKQSLQRRRGWPEDCRFLGRDAMLSGPDAHPWLEEIDCLPCGKREHLLSLVHIQHFLDRHGIGGEHVHPLMNQPLIEYCLSVPSWMWSAGGRDRAVARHAFEDSLPRLVTARRTKGSLQGHFHRRFRALAPMLRELLLEGELARTSITDRSAIEAILGDGGHDDETAMRLTEIATLERWLGSWRRAGAR